jgi:Nuclease-related domain
MKQISNKKNSLSYLYYLLFGYYLALEPFFLVRLFNTYLPNFYYRGLTLPISIVLGIVGFQKMRAAVLLPNISQVYRAICQVPKNLLKPKFWKNVLKISKRFSRDLINLFRKSNSKEPMVQIHQKEGLKATHLAIISSILAFPSLYYLFVTNLSDFGLFETIQTILGYFCMYLILVLLCIKVVSVSTIKQNNGHKSANDLDALLCHLRSGLEDWHFEDRVILEKLEGEKGDIDIMAISPEGNYFIIELKSHEGIVRWDSTLEKLCHKLKKDPEFKPFKEDFFAQVKGQGKRLQDFRKLPRFPDLIIVFWRAKIDINPKKNLIKKVKIVDRSRLIRELKKRNNRLVKEMVSE